MLKSRSTGDKRSLHIVATRILCVTVISALIVDHETTVEISSEMGHNIQVECGTKRHQWVTHPKTKSFAVAKVCHALRGWRTSAISGPYGGILRRILLYISKH